MACPGMGKVMDFVDWVHSVSWSNSYYDGCGVIGAVLAELLKWWSNREDISRISALIRNKKVYWFLNCCMFAAGGLIVHGYFDSGVKFNVILALNVGATVPVLLKALLERAPSAQITGDPKSP